MFLQPNFEFSSPLKCGQPAPDVLLQVVLNLTHPTIIVIKDKSLLPHHQYHHRHPKNNQLITGHRVSTQPILPILRWYECHGPSFARDLLTTEKTLYTLLLPSTVKMYCHHFSIFKKFIFSEWIPAMREVQQIVRVRSIQDILNF